MTCFVDTTAIYASLDADDEFHDRCVRAWKDLTGREVPLVTSNYVLLESFVLIQKRLGIGALRDYQEALVPLLKIQWVDESTHMMAARSSLNVGRRKMSIVDFTSFEIMRRLGIHLALTFDRHFKGQGFDCIP